MEYQNFIFTIWNFPFFFFFYQHWWNKISMLMRRYPRVSTRALARISREKKEKITMEFPSLCPRPNNEKQSYWTSDYALTLLNRYYPYCDCGGQHGCEWNYAWNANAICWIFSHDSRENSLRLPDRGLRERWRSFFHVNRRRMLQCQTRDSFNFCRWD